MREELERPGVDGLLVALACVVLRAEAAGRDHLERGVFLDPVLVADFLLRVAVDGGDLNYAVKGLCERVVILDKGLAVGRVLVELDELDVIHRVRLLDVRSEVEMVELAASSKRAAGWQPHFSDTSRRLRRIC